jgi:predicted Zn-dependent protease
MKNMETVLKNIFRAAGGAQCEIMAWKREGALTRFADNVISQNVSSSSLDFSVRLLEGGRSAKVKFNQTDDGTIKNAITSGLQTLRNQKKDPALLPLAKTRVLPRGKNIYDKETAGLSPSFRAQKAAELARACKKAGQTAYGTVDNGFTELVIANSTGLMARHRESFATHSVTVRDRDGFGWAERSSHDAKEIDFRLLNETARAKASASRSPREIKPGKYSVILEPAAAASLLSSLGVYGFAGQFYNDGRSFVCGKLGKKVLSPLLSIEDNALDGAAAGMPFDFEGQPRSRVTLVDKGVIKAVVHDRKTAKKAGTASTGHALPQPSYMGPVPLNLAVKPGQGSLEDLIKGTERGILVTQFHYTNMLKAQTIEMTGMTRNGTFFVENGRIAYPIKNMRFTQSMVEVFTNIEAVSGQLSLFSEWGNISCPAMRLGGFNFSSSTKF